MCAADSNAYTDYKVTCYTLEAPFYAGEVRADRKMSRPQEHVSKSTMSDEPDAPVASGTNSSGGSNSLPALLHILHELVFRAKLGASQSSRGSRRSKSGGAVGSEGRSTAEAAEASAPACSPSEQELIDAIERERLAVLSEAAMRNSTEYRVEVAAVAQVRWWQWRLEAVSAPRLEPHASSSSDAAAL
jgi:hypothetical protein